ncbi:MAG: PAS domain-containing protein [Puniceicoccaceae bacterium]
MTSANPSDPHDPLLDALLAQTGEAVLVAKAEDCKILRSNARAQDLLGWKEGELKKMDLGQLWPEQSSKELSALIDSLSAPGQSARFEGFLEHRDGFPFSCEFTCSTVEAGEPFYLITFQDVSDTVQAREDIALRNIAIANVTSGVTVADARQPDLPLIYVNKGFQDITGYSAKEAIGRSCRFLQGTDRDQLELEHLRKCLRNGEACIVRLRNYRKDGSLFHNELHISPVYSEKGELTHFVGIQLDVTEQVKAQESLQRSEKRYRQALEQEKELNDIKTRFISMVSHEFRTPMTGIRASAALLRKYGDKLQEAKKERHLENIDVSLKRMNRLLDDVLFFSQAESDKVKVSLKPVDLATYMPAFIERFSPIHPDREILSDCRIPEGNPYLLDEHLLDHILQNLLGNAVKYSGGESPVTCTVDESKTHLRFSIRDKGIGIPEADQKRLFEAFHRAGNVGARQGTGLGLNIVRRAVELLKGEIEFSSTENEGSTFSVSLPKHTESKGNP